MPGAVLTNVPGVGSLRRTASAFHGTCQQRCSVPALALPGARAAKEPRGCCARPAAHWAPRGHAGNAASQDAGLHTTHGASPSRGAAQTLAQRHLQSKKQSVHSHDSHQSPGCEWLERWPLLGLRRSRFNLEILGVLGFQKLSTCDVEPHQSCHNC